jgi:hypothetical protein
MTDPSHGRIAAFRKFIRYKVRLLLALVFWIHAMGLTHLIRVRFIGGLPEARLISEISLLAIIFFYSYLAANGWWSLFFDLSYVYLFPLWIIAKYGWKLTKSAATPLGRHLIKSAALPNANAPTASNTEKKTDKELEHPEFGRGFARPFQQFALLWCGVVLLSHVRPLTAAGVFVIALAAVKTVISMNGFLGGSMDWLAKAQSRVTEILNKTTDQVLQQDPNSKECRNGVVSIRFYEGILRWLCDRDGIERWVQGSTLLLLVPYYVYLSILSGFVYLGLARILGLAWTAKEALLDAMFMPLAWTDLPHSVLIRALAGLQVCVLAFVGYEAIFRRISNKADRIVKTAKELSRKFANPDLQAKILIITQSAATSVPAPSMLGAQSEKE